jgi:hypothetical protein
MSADARRCVVCSDGAPVSGALCAGCRAGIDGDDGLTPGALTGGVVGGGAWLADRWGRLHGVADPMRVGRHGPDLAIASAAVSREHARIVRDRDRWVVADAGSRNGTFVGERRVDGAAPVRHGDRVRFGTTSLWFVERGVAPAHLRPQEGATETVSASASRWEQVRIPGERRLLLLEPALGGGGLLVTEGAELSLTLLQHALLRRLVDRNVADHAQDASVRGFVPWSNLAADLPWDSVDPDGAHLKRLIARVRRLLGGSPLAIEARHGLGYRIWSADSR